MSEVAGAPVQTAYWLRLYPGVLICTLLAGVAWAVHSLVPAISVALAAVLLGGLVGNIPPIGRAGAAGFGFCSRTLLRAGVVLLGFRLHLGELLDVGPDLIWIVATVLVTLAGTNWICQRLGIGSSLSLLVAVGYAVCGASAIAAMSGVVDADDDEVSYAITLVTLAGTLSVFILPAVATMTSMDPSSFGSWVGVSVHDVSQVVAAAAAYDTDSLEPAIVVKLSRVALLAPIVALVAMKTRGSRSGTQGVKLLPGFVVGFLGASALRTIGAVPDMVLAAIAPATAVVLLVALVGLGAGARVTNMRTLGARPVLAGGIAWLLVSITGLLLMGRG